jgi:hypothetical protein
MIRTMDREAAPDRHGRAVEQTAGWAIAAVEAGDYQEALSWLRVLEVVERGLPKELVGLRAHCVSLVEERAARYAQRRGPDLAVMTR